MAMAGAARVFARPCFDTVVPPQCLGFLRSTVILYKGVLKEGGSKERRGFTLGIWLGLWYLGIRESGNHRLKNP